MPKSKQWICCSVIPRVGRSRQLSLPCVQFRGKRGMPTKSSSIWWTTNSSTASLTRVRRWSSLTERQSSLRTLFSLVVSVHTSAVRFEILIVLQLVFTKPQTTGYQQLWHGSWPSFADWIVKTSSSVSLGPTEARCRVWNNEQFVDSTYRGPMNFHPIFYSLVN